MKQFSLDKQRHPFVSDMLKPFFASTTTSTPTHLPTNELNYAQLFLSMPRPDDDTNDDSLTSKQTMGFKLFSIKRNVYFTRYYYTYTSCNSKKHNSFGFFLIGRELTPFTLSFCVCFLIPTKIMSLRATKNRIQDSRVPLTQEYH